MCTPLCSLFTFLLNSKSKYRWQGKPCRTKLCIKLLKYAASSKNKTLEPTTFITQTYLIVKLIYSDEDESNWIIEKGQKLVEGEKEGKREREREIYYFQSLSHNIIKLHVYSGWECFQLNMKKPWLETDKSVQLWMHEIISFCKPLSFHGMPFLPKKKKIMQGHRLTSCHCTKKREATELHDKMH